MESGRSGRGTLFLNGFASFMGVTSFTSKTKRP
jgi:hypothetical protein